MSQKWTYRWWHITNGNSGVVTMSEGHRYETLEEMLADWNVNSNGEWLYWVEDEQTG